MVPGICVKLGEGFEGSRDVGRPWGRVGLTVSEVRSFK